MIKFFATAAILSAVAVPAFASTAAEQRFVHDGKTYVYTKVANADRVLISGRTLPSGSTFRLTVRGNRVSGTSNGVPVAFDVPTAQSAIGTETPSR